MRAVCLGPGGSRGVFQIGALRYLLDNENVDYDLYIGMSVGALNASVLATGPLNETLPKLEKVWLEDIGSNDSVWQHYLWNRVLFGIAVISVFIILIFVSLFMVWPKLLTIIFFILALFSLYLPYNALKNSKSIYTTSPLYGLIERNLDINKLRNSGKELRVGAVAYETGEYKIVDQSNENITGWVMASSAFPIFFPMVEMENKHWADGGMSYMSSVIEAINMGATDIDIILTAPVDVGHAKSLGIPKQIMRIFDLIYNEILYNDINLCLKIPGNVRIIMPTESLGVSSLVFDPSKIKEMYNQGKSNLKIIKKSYYETIIP